MVSEPFWLGRTGDELPKVLDQFVLVLHLDVKLGCYTR